MKPHETPTGNLDEDPFWELKNALFVNKKLSNIYLNLNFLQLGVVQNVHRNKQKNTMKIVEIPFSRDP